MARDPELVALIESAVNIPSLPFLLDVSHSHNLSEKNSEREAWVRECWVKLMTVRLVQERLEKCQKVEGVNNYEACKWLSDLYLKKLAENKGV